MDESLPVLSFPNFPPSLPPPCPDLSFLPSNAPSPPRQIQHSRQDLEGHHEERPTEHARPVGPRGGQDPGASEEVLGAPGVDPARPQRVPGEEAPLLPQVLLPVQRGAARDSERDQRPQQVLVLPAIH